MLSGVSLIAVLLLIVVSIVSFIQLKNIISHKNELILGAMNQRLEIEQLRFLDEAKVAHYRGYLWTGNEVFLERYKTADKHFGGKLRRMMDTETDPQEKKTLAEIAKAERQKENALADAFAMKKGRKEFLLHEEFDEKLLPKRAHLANLLKTLAEQVDSEFSTIKEDTEKEATRSIRFLSIYGLIALAILGIATYFSNHLLGRLYLKEHQTSDRLLMANARLEKFSRVVSHDLKEPFRTIGLYVELMKSELAAKADPNTSQYMDFISNACKRANVLIEDLLSFSRSSNAAPKYASVNLNEVLQEVLSNLKASVTEKNAVIETMPLPSLEADRTLLTQLFQNLLANALKFQGGGTARVKVWVKDGKENYQFAIEDNGIGFDPGDGQKIFQPFFRSQTSKAFAGSGIGLGTCKEIVEAHGGKIWAESTLGKGSIFYFELPKKRFIAQKTVRGLGFFLRTPRTV